MDIHNTGNIITGSRNTVSATSTGNIMESGEISEEDWKELENIFKEIVSKTDVNPKEHTLAVSAQYQISRKDKDGLKKIIEENANDFKNSFFSQIAAAGVIEIIKKVTGLVI